MTSAEHGHPAARPRWRDEPVDRQIRARNLIAVVIGLVVLGLAVADLARETTGRVVGTRRRVTAVLRSVRPAPGPTPPSVPDSHEGRQP